MHPPRFYHEFARMGFYLILDRKSKDIIARTERLYEAERIVDAMNKFYSS